jgi:hypothetical protein
VRGYVGMRPVKMESDDTSKTALARMGCSTWWPGERTSAKSGAE